MAYKRVDTKVNGTPYRKESFHVSYSEFAIWRGCGLKYERDVINEDCKPFNGNIYTLFGTLIHEYVQDMLAEKRPLDGFARPFKEDFEKISLKNMDLIDNYSPKLINEFSKDGILILDGIRTRIKNSWKKWTFISAEHKLLLEVPSNFTANAIDDRKLIENIVNVRYNKGPRFKGFIDLVMKDEEGNIVLIDLKTSTRSWDRYKKSDQIIKAQLKLYKYFYHIETGTPLNKIKTEYIVLIRKGKTKIQKVEHSFGKVALNNEMNKLKDFFNSVYINKVHLPSYNRNVCKWCEWKSDCNVL